MKTLVMLLVLPIILLSLAGHAFADDPEGTAAAPGGPVKVRWEGVAAELLRGKEPTEPYSATFPSVPPENPRWQLYTGEVGGASRQVYETRRWLWYSTWSADGLRMGVRYNTYPPFRPDLEVTGGVLSFDNVNVTRAPSDLAFGLLRTSAFDVLPGGAKVLVLARSTLDPFAPPPPLLMVDAENRTAFTPAGLTGSVTPAADRPWSPDGAYVLLYVSAPQVGPILGGYVPPPISVYSVSTADGTARLMMAEAAVRTFSAAVWSPTAPHKAAYTRDGALWVFDPRSGSRRLTPDGTFKIVDRPAWHDAQRLWIDNKMVDVATGKVITYELGQYAATAAVSPDGRYAVTFDFPQPYGDSNERQCPATKLPQNRVALFDLATGAASPLKGCDGRAFTRFQWMGDSRHVVMTGADITCCHGSNYRIVLKDVISGAETPLTRGFEEGALAVVSPDGKKVIVTGDKLRVYTSDGELLQETDPPTGFNVTHAAWAPDSKRFSFIAGPTGVWGP